MKIVLICGFIFFSATCFSAPLVGSFFCGAKEGAWSVNITPKSGSAINVNIEIRNTGLSMGAFGKLKRTLTGTWQFSEDTQSAFGDLDQVRVDNNLLTLFRSMGGLKVLSADKIELTAPSAVLFNNQVGHTSGVDKVFCTRTSL